MSITSHSSTSPANIGKRLMGAAAALALAAGLAIAAPAAEAEAANVWDRVAKCESGGRWGINTGNGYYGGLQFSRSTWRAYGGSKYASTANKASKNEQIRIAKRVLKGQGPGAWPVCSKRAGLTRSNGAAVSTGSKAKKSTKAKPSKSKATKKKASKSKASKKATSAKTVRVRSGDSLGKIAKRYHVKGGWKALWKMNKKTVKNPNRIRVGQSLRVR